ncbi:MAG: ATP-binding cassette domain-containing protein [Blautia obeum]
MIKLALIDNGIPYHMRNNRNQRIVHKSFLASKCDPSEYKDDKSFHGAVCVGIITSICSDIELWDLNVTDSAGTTQITVLLEALEWCIQNKIKLIHMSLGTINYFDIKPLWIQIKRLLDADAIIVAAYHNRNIKTYPAAYPGVFGVRQDRYGLLGNGQILFQEQKGYNIENSIIANFSWNGIVNQANSYAAPVVTGHIATYLNRKPTAGFDDVMDFLMTIATHKSDYPDILENVIRDKTNIEIPVIAGIDLDYEEMIQLIGMDIDNVSSVVDQITQFSISSILQIIGGVVGLSLLDWKLAILIEAIIPLKFIIVSYCANKKREVFEQWIEDKRKFMSWFAECINGIHEMKLWNLFQVKKSQFEGLQKDLMDSYKKNAMLDEYSTVSVVVIDTVVNALLYILSGLFIIKGEFTIGGAFAFITYSAYVVNPISALINIKYYFAQIEPSAKRLFELWGQPEELEMKLCEMKPEKIYQDRDMVFEVKNLVFGYEPGHPILNGISLCVKKGERIAIVGENGSGKSTLLNLLAGFYRPQKGIIKLYGAPVELMDIQDMRNRIAVISQRPYLFQGTIEENVNIDGKASRDAVVEACRKSGALGFIEKLDHGFGQKIGQDGAKLSGGERQKIAVARALLKNADILLMDEATEGFDVESNEALRELLHSELKNKTIVFITHKYKELESVDKVYRLSKGILELVRS